ncbi:conserved Plasmodium protein, unknown function [Plasmodium vinckei brucechwatti]|uniref:Uncharacterized protein n=1 Tax=Plasmodium vinckei brucechwatti TaxID=119398 RepID=A0A6V7SBY5_PLAVN|nr:conserved Plasmodium protein, unknown function [Plasmodium vinckei brucechwatti]
MNIFFVFLFSFVLSFTSRDTKGYILFLARENDAPKSTNYQKIERILSDDSGSDMSIEEHVEPTTQIIVQDAFSMISSEGQGKRNYINNEFINIKKCIKIQFQLSYINPIPPTRKMYTDPFPPTSKMSDTNPMPSTSKMSETNPMPSTSKMPDPNIPASSSSIHANPFPSTSRMSREEATRVYLQKMRDAITKMNFDYRDEYREWKYKNTSASTGLINCYLDGIFDKRSVHDSGTWKQSEELSEVDQKIKEANEKCISTYLYKSNQMINLSLKKGSEAYAEICKMCIHMFSSHDECLSNSINLSWNGTVIMTPVLYMKYDSTDNEKNEGMIINFPVTHILSKLLANLISLVSYNKYDIEYISSTLQHLLVYELTNNLNDLPKSLGFFDTHISLYTDSLNNIFDQIPNNNKNMDILDHYTYFEGYLDRVQMINNKLLYLSKNQYWTQKRRITRRKRLLSVFHKMSLYKSMDYHIKDIYKFVHTNFAVVDGIKTIYNDEKNILYTKEEEDLRLYYIRNEALIKKHCSVYIVTAISWFLNQVNLNMYDNNKDVLTLFREKFSSENINKIIKSLYTYKDFYEKNVINVCVQSMEEIIEIVGSAMLIHANKEVTLLKNNLTFSNLIRSLELILLQSKINSISKEEDQPSDDDDDMEISYELRSHENLICLMKYLSKEMEFYISSLKSEYFKKPIKENYNNFKTNVNYVAHETGLYFCTLPGRYFVHRIFTTDILYLINMHFQ